jgi:superfamily II DNA or RNA helicase
MEFIESLNLPHKIRDYQFDAFVEGIKRMRAILVSPTGSGKSLIIYCLMRWYIDNYSDKVLIIVPTTSLVEQMNSDFKSYGYNDSHLVYSGKDKNTDKRVMISTWQSIHRLNIDWFDQFGLVFGDECHGFKAKSLTSIMHKARQAKYRFGTTGTLDGSQTHELVLQGLFGKIFKVTTTRKLQDSDTLAQLNISMVMLNHSNEIKKDFSKKTYHEEIDYLINNTNRNSFISKLASDQKGNTLVLFQFVEKHGKVLYDLINNRIDEKRKLFFVSGEVDTTDREAIRGIVEKQDNAIIVASLGTFSTGINIRNLHNIIFASPSKSQIRVLQSIGRGLRKSDNNVNTRLFDIADDIRSKDKTNYSYIHALERIKIYKKEKFNFKIHKVDLT